MSRLLAWTLILVAVPSAIFAAETVPADDAPVRLQPARWRATRQIVQACSEQAQFRWAMPDTVSRRAWTGTNDGAPQNASDVLKEVGKQTGITFELIGGIVVGHLPKEAKRKALVEKARGKDRRAALQAICELGWLSDAYAWPELAKIAVGEDVELALAAAQALRRLEGEKYLDWRRTGVSADDPELPNDKKYEGHGVVPLGAAFPEAVPLAAIEKLAGSTYLPLREASVRLAACWGFERTEDLIGVAMGFAGTDTSAPPLVEHVAGQWLDLDWMPDAKARQLRPLLPPLASKQESWWLRPAPDLAAAAQELAQNKDHDTVWRLTGRRVAYLGTPEAIQVMLDYGKSGGRWSSHVSRALAEWCGGPEVVAWLQKNSAVGNFEYGHDVGWSLWGLSALQDGEELAASLRPALLQERSLWAAPPEFTAAQGAGIYSLDPLLGRIERRGHWVCLAIGHIGGPVAVEELIDRLNDPDPGVAIAAAKGLGMTSSLAGVAPLIKQLKHPDRLRRQWAVLALGQIGGPEAIDAIEKLLAGDDPIDDRLVRRAAAQMLHELAAAKFNEEALFAMWDRLEAKYAPEYRPRNAKFDATFPINAEVVLKEFKPATYSSIGETRAAYDFANKLVLRYGGCTGCYSNECFAFDVGTATWFPIRAADQYCHFFHEVRPNAGCSRGMTYDGVHHRFWIGQGIGSSNGPTGRTQNRDMGVAAYDAATDRFKPLAARETKTANAYSGEPAKMFAFDYDQRLVISSASGGKGIGVIEPTKLTKLLEAPSEMPSWDQYRPPAFCYDPLGRQLLCTHPDLGWKLLRYDFAKKSYRLSADPYPGAPNKQVMGGLVWDSGNQELILIGGIDRETKGVMPTCRYDRAADRWIDLKAENLGQMGKGQGTCVYDPEHNIVIEVISGAVYRFKNVPVGTKAVYKK